MSNRHCAERNTSVSSQSQQPLPPNQQDLAETYRFRVFRINSVAVGCHHDPKSISSISEEEDKDTDPYITSYPFQPLVHDSPSTASEESEKRESTEFGSGERKFSIKNSFNRVSLNNPFGRKQSVPISVTMSNPGQTAATRKFSLGRMLGLGRRRSSTLPEVEDFAQTNSTVRVNGTSYVGYPTDALPQMENYKNMLSYQAAQRPTIEELHDGQFRVRKVRFSFIFLLLRTGIACGKNLNLMVPSVGSWWKRRGRAAIYASEVWMGRGMSGMVF